MTLTDIITRALEQLRRGTDSQTINDYRSRYTQYANEAQQDLAKDFPIYRYETVNVEDNTIDLNSLERWCTKLISIRKGAKDVAFDAADESGIISVSENGDIRICYRYLPKPLDNLTDVPDLPEHLHQCIVTYVVARDITEGDASTQGGASVYFELYRDQKRRLMRGGYGTPMSYKLVNMERW